MRRKKSIRRRRATVLQRIIRAAGRVPADSPYRLGDKVLLTRVSAESGIPIGVLADKLGKAHKSGRATLSRIDLVQAFDRAPKALAKSHIQISGADYHAVTVAPRKSRLR